LLGNDPTENSDNQDNGDKTATDTAIDVITSPPSVIIDQQNLQNETTTVNGNSDVAASAKGPFSVQYGSFSAKDGADALSVELSGKGIYSYVYESGGSYKVLGLPYSTEEKARGAASVVSAVVSDVFVVNLSKLIP